MIEFDDGDAGDRHRQHAGQQDRSIEIGKKHQQQGSIEEKCGDGKRQMLNAPFHQGNRGDGRHKDQN